MKSFYLVLCFLFCGSSFLVCQENESDASFSHKFRLSRWWNEYEDNKPNGYPSVINFEFKLTIEDSTAVIMNVLWEDNGAVFHTTDCKFNVELGEGKIIEFRPMRSSHLTNRPTLFTSNGNQIFSIQTFMSFDSLSRAIPADTQLGEKIYKLKLYVGAYFPEGRNLINPRGNFPFYFETKWLEFKVDWEREEFVISDPNIRLGKP